jgi:hypothetical protein
MWPTAPCGVGSSRKSHPTRLERTARRAPVSAENLNPEAAVMKSACFHHLGTVCISAYGFLISERETIPPQDLVPPGCSRNLPFPTVTDPAAPPIRPGRHVPNSIARTLPRCPCCARRFTRNARRAL